MLGDGNQDMTNSERGKEEKGDTAFCARSVSSSSAFGYTNPMTDEIEIFTSTDKEFYNNLKLAYYGAQ
jgi:hypothetical protein